MSTITILGATGQVGSKTVVNLLNKGHALRLIARQVDKLGQFSHEPGVEIYPGNSLEADFLAEAFTGSDVVMLMMPGDMQSENIGVYQDKMGIAQVEAIKKAGVKKILFLSSLGGHTEECTGMVAGLARQERRLMEIENADVVILRPGHFMENFLGYIQLVKSMGIISGPIKPDREFPMIATRDVAFVAAKKLDELNWRGKSVLALLGPRDYSMIEVTKVLGNAIGRPDLPYIQCPYEQAKESMKQIGFSDSIVDSYIEMIDAINCGIFNLEIRDRETTTQTTIEDFSNTFVDVYSLN